MALTDKLTSIADAIREKGGTTEKLTLDAMPTAIATLPTGGGGEDKVPNPLVITKGNQLFEYDSFKFVREFYADRIQTALINANNMFGFCSKTKDVGLGFTLNMDKDITTLDAEYMFRDCDFVPTDEEMGNIVLNHSTGIFFQNTYRGKYPSLRFPEEEHSTTRNCNSLFYKCQATEIGTIYNYQPYLQANQMFYDAKYLRHCPHFENFMNHNLIGSKSTASTNMSNSFYGCYSLRTVDAEFLRNMVANKQTTASYHPFGNMFSSCYSLDEIVGIVPAGSVAITYNLFTNTFYRNCRVKRITFALQETGEPYEVQWKSQTIDLSSAVGWAGAAGTDTGILNYNSGITADKEVKNIDDYNRLKDDPDWWTKQFVFSRFGHDAAVELINSLPDTSAYVAAQNASNNVVKFKRNAGMNIDGGSVSQLTEEEIAVAAAKGWTISYTD